MGEIFKMEDFESKRQGGPDGKKKDLNTGGSLVSFEKAKEIIEAERRYGEFENRYKNLMALRLKPNNPEEFEALAGKLVGELEAFINEVVKLRLRVTESGKIIERQFTDMMDKGGFNNADEKHGIESARDGDRFYKLIHLEDKASLLTDRVVSLLG